MVQATLKVPQLPPAVIAADILNRLDSIGIDSAAILRQARIEQSYPGALGSTCFTAGELVSLYREGMFACEAYASRDSGRAPMLLAETHVLCHSVITCDTLSDAIQRCADFCRMLGERAGELSLLERDGVALFEMKTHRKRRDVSAYLADLTGLATFHRLFGWLIGMEIELLAAEVCYPRLPTSAIEVDLMPIGLIHDSHTNQLKFSSHYLRCPVVRSGAELKAYLQTFPYERGVADTSLAGKLTALLCRTLSAGEALPSMEYLAYIHHMSVATLRRRLEQEGTSIKLIKQDCSYNLACALLEQTSLSTGEIAGRLGFADAASFSRSFRNRAGIPPSRWRARRRSRPCANVPRT